MADHYVNLHNVRHQVLFILILLLLTEIQIKLDDPLKCAEVANPSRCQQIVALGLSK